MFSLGSPINEGRLATHSTPITPPCHFPAQPFCAELKKLWWLLRQKCHNKIELCVNLTVLQLLFHVGQLVQNRQSVLLLAWHECFSCKGREQRFTAAGWHCRQTLKYWIFCPYIWPTKSKITLKSTPCM